METTTPSLYERLGGEAGVSALIDRFYDRLLSDPELSPFFVKAPVDRIRLMQKAFFAAALDGPMRYTGGDLYSVHRGMRVRERHFSHYVHLLLGTLGEMGIPEADLHATIDRMALYASDIVTGGDESE